MQTLQQVVDERISFLKEQINPRNKPEENKTLQLQIDAIRSAAAAAAVDDDVEEVEAMIAEKKALLKKSEDVYEFDRLSAELEGLEWLQRQISRLLGIKQMNRCSICGKKLKKNFKRKRTSENLLVCWQCMIVNNNNADF